MRKGIKSGGIVSHIYADLTLTDQPFFILEKVLDWILQRHHLAASVLHYMVYDSSQRA